MMKSAGKRGVSEMIAYVLLISIAVAISILVYIWLQQSVPITTENKCPDEVSLVIENYSCGGGQINLTLKNKGTFDIRGFTVKTNNQTGAFGIDMCDPLGFPILTNDENVTNCSWTGNIELVDVQPYIISNGKRQNCNPIVENVTC